MSVGREWGVVFFEALSARKARFHGKNWRKVAIF